MWTARTWAALLLSGLIGLFLGLIGGGGSIITGETAAAARGKSGG